ncbi:hypothetical protein [Stigmatella aurantiaca]|uniref:Conserved uncharacterized protein n=1 Tax=Stigmatella aurantiaca (strain DW4/3-1) TaxID=378806 RepID=E3FYS7_STIAD|nr:hypothetical protein [Stigmatella aurantiaca]ADO72390.1 conserved uncharacterized protein [Stigmatella aurantiaca DW4/3-1]
MGFSPLGLALVAAILAPSLMLLFWPSSGPWPASRSAGVSFDAVEHAGRVASCALLLLAGPSLEDVSSHGWGSVGLAGASVAFVGLNGVPWARYLQSGRSLEALFRPLWGVPVPGAVFPVGALLCAAAVSGSWWLAAASLVFAVGHLANSWHMWKHLRRASR